jgi:hypothetical protein
LFINTEYPFRCLWYTVSNEISAVKGFLGPAKAGFFQKGYHRGLNPAAFPNTAFISKIRMPLKTLLWALI